MTLNLGNLQTRSNQVDNRWFDVTLGHNHDGINSRLLDPLSLGGWKSTEDNLAYVAADAPSFTASIYGDRRDRFFPGMRLRYNQEQAITSLWHMENNSVDSIAAHDGTDTDVTYNASYAKFGSYGADFDGDSSKIVLADHADLKPTGRFTVGAWIKTTQATTGLIYSCRADAAGKVSGFNFYITGGKLSCDDGANTGSTLNTDYINIISNTSVNDGNWHMCVLTWNGAWLSIYIDGVLDVRKYWGSAPVYASPTYPRIGCSGGSGGDGAFFDGSIDEVFLINGYALGETNIKAIYDANTALSSPLTLTKFGIITVCSYSNLNTNLTIYGGTDYVMVGSMITQPYFSTHGHPFGFPHNDTKWTEMNLLNIEQTYSSPTTAWKTVISLNIPIGCWDVFFYGNCGFSSSAVSRDIIDLALSTSTSSVSDPELYDGASMQLAIAADQSIAPLRSKKTLLLTTKTLYYLIVRQTGATAGTCSYLWVEGQLYTTYIKARCAYL